MPQFAGKVRPAAVHWPKPSIMRYLCLTALIAALVIAAGAELRAQAVPGEDANVLAAATALDGAMRGNDKSVARKLLSLQFTYTDENGVIHERKEFLTDVKAAAPAAAAADVKVNIYGLVAAVTGNRKSALGSNVFFLDIWAKQKGSWRILTMQDVVLTKNEPSAAVPDAAAADAAPHDCKNPCQTIPYRVRSPAEQDIVNTYQALVKAGVDHDADDWSKHVGDDFVLYRTGRAPIPKSDIITTIQRQKKNNIAVTFSEIEAMRLSVYGDGAAMIASHVSPDHVSPDEPHASYRAASVWAKRAGQWQLAISIETEVK